MPKESRNTSEAHGDKGILVSRSFIVSHGKVGTSLRHLVHDMRNVMSPYTAAKLENRHNSVKDFQAVASLLHVTHLIAFTATDIGTYMRASRMPRGPTLTFRVHSYSLAKDINKLHKRSVTQDELLSPALVVMSGFGSEENHVKLMKTMFQNMFPTLSVANTQQKQCKRVVLIKFNNDTQRVELRHYVISLSHVGLSRTVKKVVTNRVGTHLNRYDDIADFILRGGDAQSSGSEAEDPNGETHVQLADHKGFLAANSQMAVRLTEVGPRLQFELVKVEADFHAGEVIYHAYVHRTPEEVKLQRKRIEELNALKAARRAEQEKNVEAKKQAKSKKRSKDTADENDDDQEGDDLDNLPKFENANSDEEADDKEGESIGAFDGQFMKTIQKQSLMVSLANVRLKGSNHSRKGATPPASTQGNPQVKFVKRHGKKVAGKNGEALTPGDGTHDKKRKHNFNVKGNKRKKVM